MATYSTPDGAAIRGYTRLNGAIFGVTDNALEASLAATVSDGEDGTFGRIGDSYETDSSLTARQVRNLQRAVSYRTGAAYVREAVVDKTTGTQEPILMEDAESLRQLAQDFEDQAETYEGLLQGAGTAVDEKPFTLPSIGASTYTRTDSDRTPSERIAALDERDNVAFDSEDA